MTDRERIEELEADVKELLKRLYDAERKLNRLDRKTDSHSKLLRKSSA